MSPFLAFSPLLSQRGSRGILLEALTPIIALVFLWPAAALAGPSNLYFWFEAESLSGVRSEQAGTADAGWRIDPAANRAARLIGGASADALAVLPADSGATSVATATFTIPKAARYRLWVRYADWRDRAEPFRIRIAQGRTVLDSTFGAEPLADRNSDSMLRYGFDLVWSAAACALREGESSLQLGTVAPAQAPRWIDAILITDDPDYVPEGRRRPITACDTYLEDIRQHGLASAPWVISTAAPAQPERWSKAAPDSCEFRPAPAPAANALGKDLFALLPTALSQADTIAAALEPGLPDTALRIAFLRGAARQSGVRWSVSFPGLFDGKPEFAGAWPSCTGYRKSLFYAWLGGASSIDAGADAANLTAEQRCFDEITGEFAAFAREHPRGGSYTPVAIVIDPRAGWSGDPGLSLSQRSIGAVFDVASYPRPRALGEPATADRQSFISGVFGDVFDVLLPSAGRQAVLEDYVAIVLAGEVELDPAWRAELKAVVESGTTLVLTAAQAAAFDEVFLGYAPRRGERRADTMLSKVSDERLASAPFPFERVVLKTAQPLAATPQGEPLVVRNLVGRGQVVTVLVPHGLGFDSQPVPALAFALAHVFSRVTPIQVHGDVQHFVNRTDAAWLLVLLNNRGVDQYPDGRLSVDRRDTQAVTISCPWQKLEAREWTMGTPVPFEPRAGGSECRLTLPAGGLYVIEIVPKTE